MTYWRSLGGLGRSFGGLCEVLGDPSEAFGLSGDDLWRTSGTSLETFELPERSFGLDFLVC